MSEILISAEKGGEFFIDTDRQLRTAATPIPSPQSSGDFSGLSPIVGFIMSCRVQGEGKHNKPLVQLAMRHVTCVEDAAIFMALAAAVDLSIVACRPFRRKLRKGSRHSLWKTQTKGIDFHEQRMALFYSLFSFIVVKLEMYRNSYLPFSRNCHLNPHENFAQAFIFGT
jgi:hypothetical protein